MKLLLPLAIGMGLCADAASAADFVNGSFEDGLTGWSYTVSATTTGQFNNSTYVFNPKEGTRLAKVGYDWDSPASLSHSVYVLANHYITGWVAFVSEDYPSFNDMGALLVNGETIFSATTQSVYDKNKGSGATPWTFFYYRTKTSGLYTLSADVYQDDELNSFILLDGVKIQSAIPEPTTWALMIAGFGLVGPALRRRRQVLA